MLHGNAIKRFFPGMPRICAEGHQYLVTEGMSQRRTYTCPICASKRAVEYARKNRERKRAWNNAYHARNSARRGPATKAYRERYPHKRDAHQAIATALRNGSLIAQACRECGAIKAAAHHDDYSKPLDVIWLCHRHHMERHAMLAERSK